MGGKNNNRWWEFRPDEKVAPDFAGWPNIFNVPYYDRQSYKICGQGPYTIKKIWGTFCNEIFMQFYEVSGTFRAHQFIHANHYPC